VRTIRVDDTGEGSGERFGLSAPQLQAVSVNATNTIRVIINQLQIYFCLKFCKGWNSREVG